MVRRLQKSLRQGIAIAILLELNLIVKATFQDHADEKHNMIILPDASSFATKEHVHTHKHDPEEDMTVMQILVHYGYKAENHTVTTDDGYILEIHRILPSNKSASQNKSVYLQHGLLASSFDYVANGPNESLGFILSDLGYDVWLGNIRGNSYCLKHIDLTPADPEFWNFSFHEMGLYDVPAIIDLILQKTNSTSLSYVGHSMGTTMFIVAMTTKPQYQEKVDIFIAMAPVAFVQHTQTALALIGHHWTEVEWIFKMIGVNEFLPSSYFNVLVSDLFCRHVVVRAVCSNALFFFSGYDMAELNYTRLPVYFRHFPEGTSVKTITHYGQLTDSAQFRQFDYGTEGNKERYNSDTPPDYNLTILNMKTAFMWGDNDLLADPTDVSRLTGAFKHIDKFTTYEIADPKWSHLDFILGVNANEKVYKQLIEYLGQTTSFQN